MRGSFLSRTAIILLLQGLLVWFPLYAQQEQPDNYASSDTEVVEYSDTLQDVIVTRQTDYATSQSTDVRQVPDSVVERFKTNKEFDYANNPAFWKKEPPADDSKFIKFMNWLSKSALMKWLLYLFLTAVIVFTIYKIMVVNDFFVFSGRRKKIADEAASAEEFTTIDLDKRIASCIEKAEYRQAVRFMYLITLRYLHDTQQIHLDAKFTNHDYVRQMQKNARGADFSRLTRFYEYAWYGEYPLSSQQFDHVHQNFNRFINSQ